MDGSLNADYAGVTAVVVVVVVFGWSHAAYVHALVTIETSVGGMVRV